MTIEVNEANLNTEIYINKPQLTDNYVFTLTSQYDKVPVQLHTSLVYSNNRYSQFTITFPTGFGDEHKNGIYYYSISSNAGVYLEKGLVKIITSPGGATGITNYTSTTAIENREADVFYRPNY